MKVIDFGIVGGVNQRTKRIAGTFRYAAPEQIHISGPSPLMAQTDLYALGCILYECLAGQGPFDSYCRTNEHYVHAHLTAQPPLISTLVPGIPKAFDDFFASILAKDPGLRPPSARACAAQLMDLPWDFTGDQDVTKTAEMLEAAIQSVVRKHEENRGGAPNQAAPQPPTARSPGQVEIAMPPSATPQMSVSARGGTMRVDGMAYPPQPENLHQDLRNVPTRTSSPANPPAQRNENDPKIADYAPPAWGSGTLPLGAFQSRSQPQIEVDARDPSTFGAVQRSFQLAGISPSARRFAAASMVVAMGILCVMLGVWLARHRAASADLAAASSSAIAAPPPIATASSIAVAADSASAAPTPSVIAPADSAAALATATSITASAPEVASVDRPHSVAPARSHASAPRAADLMPPSATIPGATASAATKPRKLPGSGL